MLLDDIARFVSTFSAYDIPDETYRTAAFFLGDTIACALAGSSAESNDIMLTAFGAAQGTCSVPGRALTTARDSAAVLTAHAIHCLEWDAVHEPAVVHAMSVTTGALWAESQSRDGISGETFLRALIIGVDIASRLGVAAGGPLRFFRPATAGLLGATAAVSYMRGMGPDQTAHAISLGYAQVHGTMQAHLEGTPTLAVQVGLSARAALTACDMAAAGMSGPVDIFSGPFGYFNLIEESGNTDQAFGSLGESFAVDELSIKPYPSGRASHGILSHILKLVHDGILDRNNLSSVTAFVPPLINRLVGRPIKSNMPEAYARLCIPFLVGLAIRDGKIDPRAFNAANVDDPVIRSIANKVTLTVNDNADPNALAPQKIVVELENGGQHAQHIPHVLGSPLNPVSTSDHTEKFAFAASIAPCACTREQSLAMLDQITNLKSIKDCGRMWRHMFSNPKTKE